jgi:hypothetical protein
MARAARVRNGFLSPYRPVGQTGSGFLNCCGDGHHNPLEKSPRLVDRVRHNHHRIVA